MNDATTKPLIRWMVHRDFAEVLRIERESFAEPWSEEDFRAVLRERNCIGMVIDPEREGKVMGYMVYELLKTRLRIVNFAVAPAHRRQGLGAAMVARLVDKLSPHRRTRITLAVRETNLPAQLFFRSQGFKAVKILRGYYDECSEDGIVMQYRLAVAGTEDTAIENVIH